MHRLLILLLFIAQLSFAQTRSIKKPAAKAPPAPETKGPPAPRDSIWAVDPNDTIDWREYDILSQRKFVVYTRRPRGKDKRLKLCVNLVADTVLNYCINDSLCKDPEKYKILFYNKEADTAYVLLFVDAFSKVPDNVACLAGHESKLFFFRWNTASNKAIVKQKSISSCRRGITNMTKFPIADWDGSSVLVVNYYRGGTNFEELHFDPGNFKLGMQSVGDNEGK